MKIKVYTKSPMWWTSEEWKMSEEEREKIGIKLIDIEYNIDTSAGHPTFEGDDIVRYSEETQRVKDKEPQHNKWNL